MLVSCSKSISKTETPTNKTEKSDISTESDKSNAENLDESTQSSQITNRNVRLYFYDVVQDKIVYYDDTVEVTDKAVTTALINELKHPKNTKVTPSISKNVNIISAKLDKEKNLFYLDLTDNFVGEMNLGSGPESSTLNAIVNTIGYNFEVNNVVITLGGKPYSSGHILKNEGESFKVSLSNASKL